MTEFSSLIGTESIIRFDRSSEMLSTRGGNISSSFVPITKKDRDHAPQAATRNHADSRLRFS